MLIFLVIKAFKQNIIFLIQRSDIFNESAAVKKGIMK
jgi:hypothetical protein